MKFLLLLIVPFLLSAWVIRSGEPVELIAVCKKWTQLTEEQKKGPAYHGPVCAESDYVRIYKAGKGPRENLGFFIFSDPKQEKK